jgi:hypothetical protein
MVKGGLTMPDAIREGWPNCYRARWNKADVHPDTFSHPAKFRPNLIRRIYLHAIGEGWLNTGDTVLDPFAGVGLGAYYALVYGLNWVGVELEPKHADVGGGCDCTGFTKAEWRQYFHRGDRMRFKERHWCPDCVRTIDWVDQKKNASRRIPHADAHRFAGNIGLWKSRYVRMPNLGDAVLLQGDSRTLLTWGRFGPGADGIVASPPYSGASGEGRTAERDRRRLEKTSPELVGRFDTCFRDEKGYGISPGQLAAMKEGSFEAAIGSPPYALTATAKNSPGVDLTKQYETYRSQGGGASFEAFCATQRKHSEGYGSHPSNLASLPEGSMDAAISSPPYCHGLSKEHTYADHEKRETSSHRDIMREKGIADPFYGQDPANLGQMKEGDFAGVVGSPPFENSIGDAANRPDKKTIRPFLPARQEVALYLRQRRGELGITCKQIDETLGTCTLYSWYEGRPAGTEIPTPEHWLKLKDILKLDDRFDDAIMTEREVEAKGKNTTDKTGHSKIDCYGSTANLGNQSGPTFWSAARIILANCHALLRPGGHAIWVVGPYVRKGKLVDFPAQWAQLCEAVGFTTLHVHRCPKVETYGTQRHLDGGEQQETVERVSFFRRLANAKGRARVDYEDVLCLERP